MKQKNASVVDTLRMLRAAIKNAEVDKGHVLSDEEVVATVGTAVKQLKDASVQYAEGKRDDLVTKAAAEVATLERYLPPQISDEELGKIIDAAVASAGASGPKDFGKVMGTVSRETKGRAEGSRVSEAVRKRLQG